MNYLAEAASLQAQINELHKKRAELVKEDVKEARDEIAKLDWCKGIDVTYEKGMDAAGLPGHILHFYSKSDLLKKTDLGFSGSVNMWGDSVHYQNNVILRSSRAAWGGYGFGNMFSFETSNVDALCGFVEACGIRINLDTKAVQLYTMLLANRTK